MDVRSGHLQSKFAVAERDENGKMRKWKNGK
jgi:hypothetical protein